MKTTILGLALMLGASSATALAGSSSTAFVQKAQADLIGQYALATLAKTHATNPAVRSLAEEVATNASASSRFLDRYAKSHDITLSSKPGFRADAQYGEMSSLKGRAFDRRCTQDVYAAAERQDGDFSPSRTGDPALKRFAQREATLLSKIGSKAHKLGG